jgi:hypothetical protein
LHTARRSTNPPVILRSDATAVAAAAAAAAAAVAVAVIKRHGSNARREFCNWLCRVTYSCKWRQQYVCSVATAAAAAAAAAAAVVCRHRLCQDRLTTTTTAAAAAVGSSVHWYGIYRSYLIQSACSTIVAAAAAKLL